MTRPLYIFDLDGTLALIEHRKHFIEGKSKDWAAFYRACVDDQPNAPVIKTLEELSPNVDIWIFSGRSDEVEIETARWLDAHGVSYDSMMMRREGDYTPDDKLKRAWYRQMLIEDQQRLVAVFDDRDKVVKMWRDEGVACFQEAPGEF